MKGYCKRVRSKKGQETIYPLECNGDSNWCAWLDTVFDYTVDRKKMTNKEMCVDWIPSGRKKKNV